MTSSPSSSAEAPVAANPIVSVVVLCLGGLMAALTQTMVIPIQSELPQLLSTSPDNASWVITITLVCAAVAMPVAGRLADLFGKQRIIVVSAAILLVGSAVAALSDTLVPMLVGRGLQGLAMGFIPVGISLIREITPPHVTNTAVAAMSATLGVGGAIGLPLSAWIADGSDWHNLFWVGTGAAAVIVVAVLVFVPHVHDAHGGRLDVPGVVLLALGLVTFLVGISKGNAWGWSDPATIGCIVGGLLVLVLFGLFELRQAEPLVDLRTTASLPILFTNLAAVAIGFGMMAQSIVVPQLLEMPEFTGYGLGQSILAAGLWMAPGGLMMLVFAPVSAGLITNLGAKKTLMTGATVLGFGYVVALFLMDAPWQLLIASCIASAGVGIGYAAMPTLVLDNAPAAEAGAAVGLNGLSRSVGTTIASAVMATILTSSMKTFDTPAGPVQAPTEGVFTACFLVGALAAFVGVGIAAFIPRKQDATSVDPVTVDAEGVHTA